MKPRLRAGRRPLLLARGHPGWAVRLRSGLGWVALAVGLAAPAAAQVPWDGWYGPPADGMFGLRFGMDRVHVDEVVRSLGLSERRGREATLRYEGKLEGRRAELVAEFADLLDGEGRGRLLRLRVTWWETSGALSRSLRLFARLEKRLTARYGDPVLRREATAGELATAHRSRVRIYRGPEMQAQLDLHAPRAGESYVYLQLDYPELQPELAGR